MIHLTDEEADVLRRLLRAVGGVVPEFIIAGGQAARLLRLHPLAVHLEWSPLLTSDTDVATVDKGHRGGDLAKALETEGFTPIAKGWPASAGDEDQAEPWTANPRWDELKAAALRFPVALAVAALEIVGDTSDEHIEYLFAGQAGGAPELWLILQALIASKDPRAVKLALRVGRSYLPDLWNDAFRFLATVRAQEVEDFFIDFLVRDEGQHPWLEKTANDYLAESAS